MPWRLRKLGYLLVNATMYAPIGQIYFLTAIPPTPALGIIRCDFISALWFFRGIILEMTKLVLDVGFMIRSWVGVPCSFILRMLTALISHSRCPALRLCQAEEAAALRERLASLIASSSMSPQSSSDANPSRKLSFNGSSSAGAEESESGAEGKGASDAGAGDENGSGDPTDEQSDHPLSRHADRYALSE